MAVVHAEDEAIDPLKTAASKSRVGRGVLPKHLPRVEEVIAPENDTCGCGAERHIIGEDVSERLDIVPAQFRVLVTRRPKYACRSCEAGVVQSPAKPRLIEGGMPTEATIASVMLASLIETCKLNKIEPHSYITGVLTAIVNGHKQKNIDQLLPWNFKG
jgi:transposase